MENELILEIGTEEIPALFLAKAEKDLKSEIIEELETNNLTFGKVKTFSTPRRLAVLVSDLKATQIDKVIEHFGPPKRIAFDEKGNPTKAAYGFAKSQNVDIKKIEIVNRSNGEFLCVRNKTKGRKSSQVLKEILPQVITSIPFRKSMRWGKGVITFARPIRWIAAVYNGSTIPFKIENIKSSNKSYGHRFISKKPFKFRNWEEYTKALDKYDVILNSSKRRQIIENNTVKLAKSVNGHVLDDPELMETVVNIVEHPTVLKGEFEKKYLKLPKEVLISVMKNHQKYFPVYSTKNGNLLSYFIFVCGTPVIDNRVVINGNEKVIRARFNDAEFFYAEDSKNKLSEYVDELKNMVYLSQIGTYFEKVKRMEKLSDLFTRAIHLENYKPDLIKSAYLSKADLATQMVFEFPELQGTMGKYYAQISGEKNSIARAIEEQYMPISRDSELPPSTLGSLLSIVDKIDNITSCFIGGLMPSGSADPYALRRQSIGIIKISLHRKLIFSLSEIITQSIELTIKSMEKNKKNEVANSISEIHENIISFFSERFKNLMIDEGYSTNIIESVISTGFDNIVNSYYRVKAVEKFKKQKGFEELLVAFKRVCNIVKEKPQSDLNTKLFKHKSEKILYNSFNKIKKSSSNYIENSDGITKDSDYLKALSSIKTLKQPIDNFFDSVLVMEKDERIRNNRLALLNEVKELFFKISDFSKI